MSQIDISIVIPSYCSHHSIDRVLKAIAAQESKYKFETIVVDSTVDSELSSRISNYEVTLIDLTEKTSASSARNIGAKSAVGELLLFIDSDIVLKADAIEQVGICYYEENHRVFGGALPLDVSEGLQFSSFMEHCFFFSESLLFKPACIRRNLPSGLFAIEAALFNEEGGFKELGRMEDTELTERISKNGNKLFYQPKVVGLIIQNLSWRHLFSKVYINGINIIYVRFGEQLHLLSRAALFLTLPILALLKGLRIIVRNIAYRKGSGRALQLFAAPMILLLSIVWMLGAYKTLLFNEGVSEAR